MSLDLILFNALYGVAGVSGLLDWLTVFLAEYLGYFLLFGFLALLFLTTYYKGFRIRAYYLSLAALSIIASRGILTEVIRFLYPRQRPFAVMDIPTLFAHDPTPGFPSGHMALFFALALVVTVMHKKWGWFFVGSVFAMGLARVVAGIHWPADILAGLLVAGISVYSVRCLLPAILSANGKV